MIRYALACDCGHEYDAWFGSSGDFDDQAERGLVECPLCGGAEVRKQVMAPAIARSGGAKKPEKAPDSAAFVKAMRDHISENFKDVGADFSKEARRMHDGESDQKAIYGTATSQETESLREDGVPFSPLPAGLTPDGAKKLN